MSMAAVAVRNQRKKQKIGPPATPSGPAMTATSAVASLPTQLPGGTAALLVFELGKLKQGKQQGATPSLPRRSSVDSPKSSSSSSSDSEEVKLE